MDLTNPAELLITSDLIAQLEKLTQRIKELDIKKSGDKK